jgi:GntR family transcriptional regulator
MATRSIPQYAALASRLLKQISAGEYRVGDLLPTEHALSDTHGLSRQTVREAIRHLAGLGLVTRQPGVGTRVLQATPNSHHAYSIGSMAELEGYADEAQLVVASVEHVLARGELARLLACREGSPWLLIEGARFRKGDSVPIGLSTIYLRDEYDGIDVVLRSLEGAIHVLLERRYHEVVEEIRQDARAVAIGPGEARELAAVSGAPAMEVVRRYYGKGDRLILSGRIIYPSERFSYAMRFRRSDSRPQAGARTG